MAITSSEVGRRPTAHQVQQNRHVGYTHWITAALCNSHKAVGWGDLEIKGRNAVVTR
jgi:hypothetical protein